MDISVVIVTYNSEESIAACVRSILGQAGVSAEIIVVDNASKDDTLGCLKPFDITVVRSEDNLGFGRGCNLGFAQATGRYIYLLNPDACLSEKDALATLCGEMDAHPQWGIAGTQICDPAGHPQFLPQRHYPNEANAGCRFSNLPGTIAWVLGASMIVRRDLYKILGGFDPDFFMYGEEADLCMRARKAGFEVGYVSKTQVKHIGGLSSRGMDPYKQSARFQNGLLLFRSKHYPAARYLAYRDMLRARFRMLLSAGLAKLQPKHSRAWHRSRWYRGVWEATNNFLAQPKSANR